MKKFALFFAIVILLVCAACNIDTVVQMGTLDIQVDFLVAKGMRAIPVETKAYDIVIRNESNDIVLSNTNSLDTTYTVTLPEGRYTIEVQAIDSKGTAIGTKGYAECTVVANQTKTATVSVPVVFMGFVESYGYTYFFEIKDGLIKYTSYQNAVCEYAAVPYTTRVTDDGIYIIYRYSTLRDMDTALYIPFDDSEFPVLYYEYGEDENDPKNHAIPISINAIKDEIIISNGTSNIGSNVYNVKFKSDNKMLVQLVDHYEADALLWYEVLFFNDEGFRSWEYYYDGDGYLERLYEFGGSAENDYIIGIDYFDAEGSHTYAETLRILDDSTISFTGFKNGTKVADVKIPDLSAYPEFAQYAETITLHIGDNVIALWDCAGKTWSYSTELKAFGNDLPVTATIEMKGKISEVVLPHMIIPNVETISVEEGTLYSVTFSVIEKAQLRLVVLPLDDSLVEAVGNSEGFVDLGDQLFGWGKITKAGWDYTYYVSFREGDVIEINPWQGIVDDEDVLQMSAPKTVKIVASSPTITISKTEVNTVYLQVKSLDDDTPLTM